MLKNLQMLKVEDSIFAKVLVDIEIKVYYCVTRLLPSNSSIKIKYKARKI